MTDSTSGYTDLHGDAGITEQDYASEPKWKQDRLDKVVKQKHEQRERAEAAERKLAQLEGRVDGMADRLNQPVQAAPAEEPQGLDKFKTVGELKKVYSKLIEQQSLASDPDATPEARAAAKAALATIDDVPGTLADITERMADIKAAKRVGDLESNWEAKTAAQAGQNELTRHLMTQYGMDALNQTSDLNKKTVEVIQGYIDSGDITQDNAGSDFIVKLAFKEAAAALKKNGRGGRENDPRHSALESGGGGRAPANVDAIAALQQRAKAGDLQAGRQARRMNLDNFLNDLRGKGGIN